MLLCILLLFWLHSQDCCESPLHFYVSIHLLFSLTCLQVLQKPVNQPSFKPRVQQQGNIKNIQVFDFASDLFKQWSSLYHSSIKAQFVKCMTWSPAKRIPYLSCRCCRSSTANQWSPCMSSEFWWAAKFYVLPTMLFLFLDIWLYNAQYVV